jgi:hypothetical protein
MFKGGAVLQRGVAVSVWGKSSQKNITLKLSEESQEESAVFVSGAVNSTGDWLVYLPPQPASWNRSLSVTDALGEAGVVVSFGETVLCAGQSNMGMQVGPSERAFDADNATAESAATVRYTGKIFLHARFSRYIKAKGVNLDSTTWFSVNPISIHNFSSVCWLTGRNLFDSMGGEVPVGLAMNAVGAHPIEAWMGPDQLEKCGIVGDCGNAPSSKIWSTSIVPMQPFTFGAMLWDQGEADIMCRREDAYPCMLGQLVGSYREQFNASFPFISVQLPGYAEGVFHMRIKQDEGAKAISDAAVIATYDDSCAEGKTDGCPHGNVHNVHKEPIGYRAALMIRAMKQLNIVDGGTSIDLEGRAATTTATTTATILVSEGPRATQAKIVARTSAPGAAAGASTTVEVSFEGGTTPFFFAGTRNCTTCCDSFDALAATSDSDAFGAGVTDFDASDGANSSSLANTTTGAMVVTGNMVRITFAEAPKWVRYTANRIFPQCALYNQEGLPALPFEMPVE